MRWRDTEARQCHSYPSQRPGTNLCGDGRGHLGARVPGDDLSSDWRQGTLAGNGTACFFDHLLGQNFLQKKVRVMFYNFHFYSSVARFIPMKMHVSVSAHKGNIFICQIQITGEILWAKFCGRSWRQNFWVKSVVWVCGKVCSEQSAKVYLLLCSSLNNPPKFDNKLYMHHGPKPKKNHQAARFSPSNIYIYII